MSVGSFTKSIEFNFLYPIKLRTLPHLPHQPTPNMISNHLSGLTGLASAPKQNAIGKGDGFGFPN